MKTVADPAYQAEIIERLLLLRLSDAARWGRMNCPQMMCHLDGAFRMALRENPVKPMRSLLRGPHGRFLALYSGLAWGKGMPTVPELDVLRAGAADVAMPAGIVEMVRRFCGASADELAEGHPMLGRMTRGDWMRWGYLHTDHHLRQFGR